jgi:hypothetical protein
MCTRPAALETRRRWISSPFVCPIRAAFPPQRSLSI